MNLLVIGIGHEKDLIIGYRFKFFISCIPNQMYWRVLQTILVIIQVHLNELECREKVNFFL